MAKAMKNVYVVAMGRSAVAKGGKKSALRNMHPVDIAGAVMKGVLEKVPQLDLKDIDDVMVGCANPAGSQGLNVARLIAYRAGLPIEVPAMTLNRFCSSGIQTIATAASTIEAGQNDVVVAGGLEIMTWQRENPDKKDINPYIYQNRKEYYYPMGITAEIVAKKYGISREDQDALGVLSNARAAAAIEAGKFVDEIIPLPGVDDEGNEIEFKVDQGVRKGTTMESLAELKSPFMEGGSVTAGTSSQVSDGAAFVVLMSGEKVQELGIKPIAKFIAYAVAGCEPGEMGIGPVFAVPKVLKNAGLTLDQIDTIELNEAFASQALYCMRTLGMDQNKVNPNGGAIALGHAMGATGAVLTCKALNELKRTGGKYALVTMCIGMGQGFAGIYELC